MKKEVLPTQFSAGLAGLGLLRTWPFLDPAEAERRLDDLQVVAAVRDRGSLEFDEADSGYAIWATTYDTRLNPLLGVEETIMRQALAEVAVSRALDVACGTGRLTRLLHSLGHSAHGVDASDEMLVAARRADPHGQYSRASIEALPFDDSSWELVVCGLALTHVESLVPALAELSRVLRPGGHLLISDVHPMAVATGAHAFFRDADGQRHFVRNQQHWHSDYIAAFVGAGLVVEHCWEPHFTTEVLDAFLSKGSVPELKNIVGLPYVLVWRCLKRAD